MRDPQRSPKCYEMTEEERLEAVTQVAKLLEPRRCDDANNTYYGAWMNDLKFTTAGEYMTEQIDEKTQRPYYINEDGTKVDVVTGQLLNSNDSQAQCLAP